jgi:hypothetical protein
MVNMNVILFVSYLNFLLQVEESMSSSSSATTSAVEMVNGVTVSSQETAERLASQHVASSLKQGDQVGQGWPHSTWPLHSSKGTR